MTPEQDALVEAVQMTGAGHALLALATEHQRVLDELAAILDTCEPTADGVIGAVRALDDMARKNGQEAWAQGKRHDAIMHAIIEANRQYEKDANP